MDFEKACGASGVKGRARGLLLLCVRVYERPPDIEFSRVPPPSLPYQPGLGFRSCCSSASLSLHRCMLIHRQELGGRILTYGAKMSTHYVKTQHLSLGLSGDLVGDAFRAHARSGCLSRVSIT
eukprot:6185741-Pleurochrysis_carterae.AAC.1